MPAFDNPQPQQQYSVSIPSPLSTPPRILIVSRRFVRKSKYVDFVGEFHLNLIVQQGGCPIIVPRVDNILRMIDAFEPIHGVLLIEGQDISPNYIRSCRTVNETAIANAHPEDADYDIEKDAIEFALVQRALDRGIPILGICRGSQIVNVAAGGSILPDVETLMIGREKVKHVDYDNYDKHRHPVAVIPNTPLHEWFDGMKCLRVNSYHHQGVDRLADRFQPMALSPDGLIEGFYDPEMYEPEEGRFVVGLQFHPERMQKTDTALKELPPVYDYPGCIKPFELFVRAAVNYKMYQGSIG